MFLKNVEVKAPIQAVFVQDKAESPLVNHVLLVADDNSSVTYVENYVTVDNAPKGIVSIVEEVIAEKKCAHYFWRCRQSCK